MRAVRAALLVWALAGSAALARPASDPAFARLQIEDTLIQSIGWRLAWGNAAFCRTKVNAIGLLVQDIANYRDPAAARAALGLVGPFGIQAVAASSPAALAGLQTNDSLLAVDGLDLASLPAAKAGDYRRLAGIHDRIDAALARDGQVRLTVSGDDGLPRELVVHGQPVCPSRFELLTSGGGADADGQRARISRKMMLRARGEDEVAAALAHEMAHNLLLHKMRLNATGRTWGNVKATELEADRLSVWLLANAGYDPVAGPRFIARVGPSYDFGFLSAPTHYRWRSRYDQMMTEILALRAAQAATGLADWSTRFVPAAEAP